MPNAEYLAALSNLGALFRAPDASDDARLDAVRRLAALARERALDVVVPAGTASATPADAAGPAGVVQLLAGLRVRRLLIRRGTGARDLAQLAGLLARAVPTADGGAALGLQRGLNDLGIWSVRIDAEVTDAESAAALAPALRAAVEAVASAATPEAIAAAYGAAAAALADAAGPAPTAPDAAAAVARALLCLRDADAARSPEAAGGDAHAAGLAELLEAHLEAVVHAVAAGTVPDAWRLVRAAPERGVPLLVDRLGEAETIAERRRCFNAILDVNGSIEPLLAGLRDPRWYVVRNVALVLAELRDPGAVRSLARALHAADARVREAAAEALSRVDAPSATHALAGALRDPSAAVRLLAACALQRAPGHGVPVSAAAVADRLCLEPDLAVARELVAALLALDTAAAYAALVAQAGGAEAGPLGEAVREEASSALSGLPAPRLVQTLRGLAQGDDPQLRAAAVRVARRLLPRAA